MGLLDFDDEKILKSRTMPAYVPKWRLHKKDAELEENFNALQNLGHSEQSADFSDSAFADRKKLCPSCLAGFSKEDVNANCTC